MLDKWLRNQNLTIAILILILYFQYWPSRGTETYGVMCVTLTDTQELATYVIRTLQLQRVSSAHVRHPCSHTVHTVTGRLALSCFELFSMNDADRPFRIQVKIMLSMCFLSLPFNIFLNVAQKMLSIGKKGFFFFL